MAIPWLQPGEDFPPIGQALTEPDGLLAAGADLSVRTLLQAYSRGIFPWYSDQDPILWWSPNPRCVLFPAHFHCSRRTRRRLQQPGWRFSLNTAFREVMEACATTPRQGQHGTWITDEMLAAYGSLHRAGYAHAFELWEQETLIGGLYGVRLGQVFFGESMFSLRTDASKAVMTLIMDHAAALQIQLLDCQVASPHLLSLGASTLPRRHFETHLQQLIRQPVRPWRPLPALPYQHWAQALSAMDSEEADHG